MMIRHSWVIWSFLVHSDKEQPILQVVISKVVYSNCSENYFRAQTIKGNSWVLAKWLKRSLINIWFTQLVSLRQTCFRQRFDTDKTDPVLNFNAWRNKGGLHLLNLIDLVMKEMHSEAVLHFNVLLTDPCDDVDDVESSSLFLVDCF